MTSPSSSPVEDTTPNPGPQFTSSGTPYWSEHHLSTSSSYFPPSSPVQQRSSSPHHQSATHPRRISTNRFPRSNSSASINRRQPGRSTSVASSSFTPRPSAMEDRRFLQVDEDEDPEQSSPDPEDDPGTAGRGRERSLARESIHDPDGHWDETDAAHAVEESFTEDDPITVKDRQSLINVQHPFGLPIWKPALYKKSRTVTRNAETDLHAHPSAVIDRHFIPGNVVWTLLFGWWLSLTFILISAVLYLVPFGGKPYARLVYGLGWYLFWPFGKYVQGDEPEVEEKQVEDDNAEDEDDGQTPDVERGPRARVPSGSGSQASTGTVRGVSPNVEHRTSTSGNAAALAVADERSSLLVDVSSPPTKGYGSLPTSPPVGKEVSAFENAKKHWLGTICFWLVLITIIAPLMLVVCLICWACVITIPMARLTWALIKHLFTRPTTIQFCPPLASEVVPSPSGGESDSPINGLADGGASAFTLKSAPRLTAGQTAPSGPGSKVLICTYRAIGLQYYKYTVGGVNIMFVILMPIVFLVIFDGFVLLPYLEKLEHENKYIPPLLALIASRSLIFVFSLASVIPLSYFIGMAVASISAQSSIGMGAVINATFGSIIEIILYAIALTQGKGKLVEGSIIGSLLAGVLLMPGASMVSGAWRKKEQKFNAKSAGVTSTMLIMAIIGTLTPTMFYQVYGNFELRCEGCPTTPFPGDTWKCSHCYYEHPDPVEDPFYQNTVKHLMYFCAAILLLSYLIGLWFSLRTHASQIWQNPQPLLNPLDLSHIQGPAGTGTGRMSMYNRIVASHLAQAIPQHTGKLLRKASTITSASVRESGQHQGGGSVQNTPYLGPGVGGFLPSGPPSPNINKRISYATGSHPKHQDPQGYHGNQASSASQPSASGKHGHLPPPLELPSNLSPEEFGRAVAATVTALGQHNAAAQLHSAVPDGGHGGGHGGHEAPAWSRGTSATVLLACTALYAAIAEILVDVVDVILEGSGIDEKFLGITLFALVPNTTEFMNAISFALNGNIALSMEIGSAYALQVCLLQIPAMVGFSAWYDPRHLGSMADTFTLIFPRWDVIAIILSIFLLTYTYIEAKSNYHRGSILILSYVVLTAGFYFAPSKLEEDTIWKYSADVLASGIIPELSVSQKARAFVLSLWKR